MNEHDLVAAAVQGDRTALGQLMQQHHTRLYRFIYYRVGQDTDAAEDLLNDVWVRVTRSIERYEDRGWPFRSWLFRIAHDRTIDYRRRESLPTRATCSLVDGLVSVDLFTHDPCDIDLLRRGLQQLTPLQQRVIAARYGDDEAFETLAARLGITAGAAKLLRHRALCKLRTIFAEACI